MVLSGGLSDTAVNYAATNGDVTSGSVYFAEYTGSSTETAGPFVGTTSVTNVSWSANFTLVRADHGSGTVTYEYMNGTSPVCQISSSIILNKVSTANMDVFHVVTI